MGVCQTADNCNANKSVARLLGLPHVGCKNHLLNLEVNQMVRSTQDLERTLDSVHETMAQCKQRLKNAALLRNLVELKPVLHNKTRWSGKLHMLERFSRIRGELIQVSEDENSDLVMNRSNAFRNKVLRYCRQMRHINLSTTYLQTRKLTLAQCQESLNMLIEDVDNGFNDPASDLYRCFLGRAYINSTANILSDVLFESGVCKIQNNESHLMSEAEHSACSALRLGLHGGGGASIAESQAGMSYEERILRCKKSKPSSPLYRNCDYIIGSAAEVERLWSIATNILTDARMKTTPILFEAIIFLRVNSRLWNPFTVKKAFHVARTEPVSRRLEEDEALSTG